MLLDYFLFISEYTVSLVNEKCENIKLFELGIKFGAYVEDEYDELKQFNYHS